MQVSFSGGPNANQFELDGFKITQSELRAYLNSQFRGAYDFKRTGNQKTKIVLIPDNVDQASDTKQSQAPNAKTMKLGEFLKDKPRDLYVSSKSAMKQFSSQKPNEIDLEIAALQKAISDMRLKVKELKHRKSRSV